MSPALWVASLLALGCGEPAPPSAMDAYLAALDSPGQPDACAAIPDVELASECLAHAARELAQDDQVEPAKAACAQIQSPMWKEECWFLVADGARLEGAEAIALCRAARRYRYQCLGHANSRSIAPALDALELGNEPETLDRMREVALTYFPPPVAAGQVKEALARYMITVREGPWGPSTCGNADVELCQAAYVFRLRRDATDRELATACASADPFAVHASVKGAVVEPEWEDQAREAWRELCQAQQARGAGRAGRRDGP